MKRAPIDWTNATFLVLVHVLAISGIAYLAFVQFSWWTVGLALVWAFMTGLGITAGYHRLFSHRAWDAVWPVRAALLCMGAGAVQNSALTWSADHRRHHAHTDKDLDPYNIQRGFLWAHMGWIFFKDSNRTYESSHDLARDPLVRFQHDHYLALAVFFGGLLPFGLGFLWGDPWGALLVAGFLRLVLTWHATFFVNSLAHTLGSRPYSQRISARDHFLTALVSLGEGYHNFHHHFPSDYRNGVRWWQVDPTKWIVWTLSRLGLASGLVRTSEAAIQRARERSSRDRGPTQGAAGGVKPTALPDESQPQGAASGAA